MVGSVAAPVGLIAATVSAGTIATGTGPSIITVSAVVMIAISVASTVSISSFVSSGTAGEWTRLLKVCVCGMCLGGKCSMNCRAESSA